MYNTIIIGAGPVGSYLAGKLAKLGYKVLVLDKKVAAGQDICCTGIVSQECLNLLPTNKNLIIRQANSARFIAPSGKSLRLWRDNNVAYVIDRPALDLVLANHAQASGTCYLFSTHVIDIQPRADCICVTANSGEQNKLFEAETAVIAAGFGSPLPAKLGLGKINDFIIGAQTEVNISGLDEVEIYLDQSLAPGGFAWLVPTRYNKGLAGLITHHQPKWHLNNLLSNLKAQGKINSTNASLSSGVIPLQPLRRSYTDRTLVVGEAAGQVKPITGGGIYYGILCADIAADSLHQAFLAHDFSKLRLANYQKRWKARLSKELKIGYWVHRIYERLDNRQVEQLHNFINSSGIPQFIPDTEDFSFDWHSELILNMLKHLAISVPTQASRAISRQKQP